VIFTVPRIANPNPATSNRGAGRQTTNSTSGPTRTSRLALGVSLADRIRHAVKPTGDQVKALDDLKLVASSISDVVKTSCPNQVALRPPEWLDAAGKSLDAMIKAVQRTASDADAAILF
jgi:hypothetical protein